ELAGHDPDRALAKPGESALLAWNPRAVPAGGIVTAELTFFRRDVLVGPPGARLARAGKGFAPVSLVAGNGEVIPLQVIASRRALERRDARRRYPDLDEVDAVRVAFALPELPGLAMAQFRVRPEPSPRLPAGDVSVSGRRIANGLVEVLVGGDGMLTLADRRTGRRFPRLCAVESEPDAGDTYSFAPGAGGAAAATGRPSVTMHAPGPLTGILEARWQALDASWRLRVELRSGEAFVRCTLGIDNRGSDRRLRARFPTGAAGTGVLAGAAFGAELRGAGAEGAAGSPAEAPVATAPAHRFVAPAGAEGGLALLVPGHAEYEWRADGDLLLTLLRSVGQLSRDTLPTRPGHAGWPTATPLAQCHGQDEVRFALAPLDGTDATAAALQRLWEEAFLPPGTRWLRDAGDLRDGHAAITLEGDDLFVSAIKPAEEGRAVVLRCWNASERAAEGRWIVSPAPRMAKRVRADESGGESLRVDPGGVIRFAAPPRGLVTIKVS
ncbi:MAG TPA: glycoside hydrolase family 38 C-terminal domain-containing protein, partial [Gemmatimonadales bacterium]